MGKREDNYNKRRLRMSYITSVISISLVLFVIGLLGLVVLGGKKLGDYAKDNLKLQVFVKDSADSPAQIKSFMEKNNYAKTVDIITSNKALEEYQALMGENPMDILDANPLPTTLEITMTPNYANNDSMVKIETELKTYFASTIIDTHKDAPLIEDVNSNINKISIILLGVCIVLSLIMIALINNTIRLAIFSKRFVIKTMQLVGATGSFIKKPFIKTGVSQGIIASFISITCLGIICYWLYIKLPSIFTSEDILWIGIIASGIILLGVLISYISTSFAVQKFLKLKMDELY